MSRRRRRARLPRAVATRYVVPGVQYTLTAPAQPGFTIVPPPTHRLVLTAWSSQDIGTVGYLVPTSANDAYGSAKNVGARWSLHTTVTGDPDYAVFFVGAGPSGATVHCRLSVDGKVLDTASTRGNYGRGVCIG